MVRIRELTESDVRFVALAALCRMLMKSNGREIILYELWRRRKAAGFLDLPALYFIFQPNDWLEQRALEVEARMLPCISLKERQVLVRS